MDKHWSDAALTLPAKLALTAVMEAIPSLSFSWHPLGFVHAEIFRNDAGTRRLHIWLANDRRPKLPNWPIHTHVFDLESRIIFGEVQDTRFKVSATESNDESTKRLYEVNYSSTSSRLVPTTTLVHAVEKTRQHFVAGESYRVPAEEFHSSHVPLRNTAVTLASATLLPDTSAPLVLGDVLAPDHELVYERVPCNAATVLQILSRC